MRWYFIIIGACLLLECVTKIMRLGTGNFTYEASPAVIAFDLVISTAMLIWTISFLGQAW
jgi:hypothetical protein